MCTRREILSEARKAEAVGEAREQKAEAEAEAREGGGGQGGGGGECVRVHQCTRSNASC